MDEAIHTANELYPSPKRVRVVLGGQVIADSRRVILLRREKAPPVYYFPLQDVQQGVLLQSGKENRPGFGQVRLYNVRAADCKRPAAATALIQPPPSLAALDGHITFDWDAMDAWFEEDQEVFVHPHDPRTRIDIAPSSAQVRVTLDGKTVAESHRPTLLFETGLQTRYYLPKLDVRQELLVPSGHLSYCPYKGEARYYSLRLGKALLENVIWTYRYPTLESAPIAGLLCFYQERIAVEVDGRRI